MKRLLLAVFTLGMALTGYAQTTPTTQVKTIADLVALGIPTINNRLSALVTGRVTENDGGGGVFFYDGASAVTTNLGTVFKPAASDGRWLRQAPDMNLQLDWFDDGSGDWVASLQSAISAIVLTSTNAGQAILFSPRTYTFATPVVVPNDGVNAKALVFQGLGGAGATQKPTLQFSTNSVGIVQFDLSNLAGMASEITIRDLRFQHSGAAPVNTSPGVGIKLAGGTYCLMENVWIQGFDIGIYLTTDTYYGRFEKVSCIGNYTAGLWGDGVGFLLNGTPFENCQFSNTINGMGCYLNTGSGTVAFKSCWFEGNSTQGLQVLTAFNTLVDSCYFELNGSYDIYCPNIYPYVGALLTVQNCYFDEDLGLSHERIRLNETRAIITNSRFFATGLNAPPIRYQGANYGVRPSIALNNEYHTATFTDQADDAGWTIIDTKHPSTHFSSATPAGYTSLKAGEIFWNTDEATILSNLGWQVTASGKNAAITDPSVTASTTATSATITVSSNTDMHLYTGDFIQIAGVDFGAGADTFAMIIDASATTPLNYVLDKVANQTVAAGAVVYRTSTVGNLLVPVGNGGTGTPTAFTLGSVIFAGASGAYTQDNANFFWNDSTDRLSIGQGATPPSKLSIAPGTVTTLGDLASAGILISGGNGNVGNLSQISLGYPGTYSPVALTAINTSSSGSTSADFVVAVRTGTTDIAPIERLRIGSTGTSMFSGSLSLNGGTPVGMLTGDPGTQTVIGAVASSGFNIGSGNGNVGNIAQISMGYNSGTYRPVSIFSIISDGAGNTASDFVIATRALTTDTAPIERVRVTASGDTQIASDLVLTIAGKGLRVKEGSNARMGTATLVGGTIAVANTSVTANTRIFISRSTTGGTEGHLSTTQVAATSFTVNSSSGTDTSTVNWLLIEPSP